MSSKALIASPILIARMAPGDDMRWSKSSQDKTRLDFFVLAVHWPVSIPWMTIGAQHVVE